jgi:four helix bundle protein
MRNFKELKIWRKGFQITINSYKITEGFPTQEKFWLSAQIHTAAISIPSNIAEGNSKN